MPVPCKVAGSLWLIFVLLSSFTFQRHKKFVPPGTVIIYEGFYADETEITNFSWFEYEYWTRIKYGYHSPEHLAVLPDTLCDRHRLVFCEPYVQHYYRHPAYREYPVNGITYEQAVAFCKWRTERVKEWYAVAHHKKIELEYRLPTKAEWEMLSLNEPHYFFKDKNGKYNFNCLQAPNDTMVHPEYKQSSQDYLLNTKSYEKNSFGLFQILGNVSEMVMEKGIAKGGNFLSKAENCRPGKDQIYERPEAWLGFRCVCELKSNSRQVQ